MHQHGRTNLAKKQKWFDNPVHMLIRKRRSVCQGLDILVSGKFCNKLKHYPYINKIQQTAAMET